MSNYYRMKIYLLLGSLFILIVLVFFVFKTNESFNSFIEFKNLGKCLFLPRGDSLKGCTNRCQSVDRKHWGGDACDYVNCRTICNNCTDSNNCKWLSESNEEEEITLEDKIGADNLPLKLKCKSISGNEEVILKWKNINNPKFKNKHFMIKYFKPYALNEGVKLKIIDIDDFTNKNNIIYTLDNLENDTTYNINVMAINKYGIGEPSNLITSFPSIKEEIIKPN